MKCKFAALGAAFCLLAAAATFAAAQAPAAAPAPAPAPAAAPAPAPAPAAAPARASLKLLDRIVAVVNDEAITLQELNTRMRITEQQLKRQNIAEPPADVLRRQVLERMIIDRAQLQLARETGVRVDDPTVNAAIARIVEQNNTTLPMFRDRLERDGISFARFREDVRDDIVMARLRDREVDSKIQISEGEVDNFLAAQAGVEAGAIEYDLAQILLRVPDNATTDQIDATRKRADALLGELRGGADFARMAASYSNAPEALQGGEIGWRTAERLPTLFLDAVKDLKPGELAPIVRSPGGFHVLKLIGKRNALESKLATGPVVQTHVRHILLRVSDAMPEAEVRRRLNDLRDRVLKGGQDFGQLARLHSVDGSATRGGDLGWLYPGDTVPEFERAMNALKPGEVSEPVQTPFGWHLIQVLERRTEASSVERNRLAARQSLRDRKADEAYQEWIRQLRDRTYVEYRLDEA